MGKPNLLIIHTDEHNFRLSRSDDGRSGFCLGTGR